MKWRHRGWAIFEAIEREAKTPSGYANVNNVDTHQPQQRDEMPRFLQHPFHFAFFSHVVTTAISWLKR